MTGQQCIDKMKEILTAKGVWPPNKESVPEEWEDALLMRFFIGFKKNPESAADAFAGMLEWREKNEINAIRKKILDGLVSEQFPRYSAVRRYDDTHIAVCGRVYDSTYYTRHI